MMAQRTVVVPEEEITQNWKKFAYTARKTGYREGIIDGRESSFQKSFDKGYIEGFKNGFVLGKYKGVLRQKGLESDNIHLQNSRRACCRICDDDKLLGNTINEIIKVQESYNKTLLTTLHSKQ